MSTCKYCGQEITFRYVDGKLTPIHLEGEWCRRDAGAQGESETVCRRTGCPHCGNSVFFLRHNGGSVWLDELGWPWPRHACFPKFAPNWMVHFEREVPRSSSGHPFGLVVMAKWQFHDRRGPSRVALAIDAGDHGWLCIAVPSEADTATELRGRLVSVDWPAKRLATANLDVRPILDLLVPPEDLRLPDEIAKRVTPPQHDGWSKSCR